MLTKKQNKEKIFKNKKCVEMCIKIYQNIYTQT